MINSDQQRSADVETPTSLPTEDILDAAIDAFFAGTHHWTPFLHPFRFRRDLEDAQKRPPLEIILRAIVYSSLQHINCETLGIDKAEVERRVELSRNEVILNELDALTIEKIQALIIVAFIIVSVAHHCSTVANQVSRFSMECWQSLVNYRLIDKNYRVLAVDSGTQ